MQGDTGGHSNARQQMLHFTSRTLIWKDVSSMFVPVVARSTKVSSLLYVILLTLILRYHSDSDLGQCDRIC